MGKFKMPSIKDIEQEEEMKEEPKEKFKVGAGLLSDVSKGSVIMKLTNIPRSKIVKNPKNNYSIQGIPSLAESIKQYGLIQPLHVAPEKDGCYMLLGGERRITAIDLLVNDPQASEWTEETLIPCVVKGIEDVKLDLSPENKERFAIITTNKEGRKYTDGDLYKEIQDWKLIIDELREKGIEYISQYDEEGNEKKVTIKGEKTRDILTQTTGVSRGQIHKFETVKNKGSDNLISALLDGKISVSTAEKAAKELEEDEQNKIAEAAERGEKITPADVNKKKPKESEKKITSAEFRKDIKKITSLLKEQEIFLDENALEKYHFYIRQIETLLGGHK